jgi:predicted dehydrogenase
MTRDATSTRRVLGVGVVGLGVGEQHAKTFATLPGCQVRALCDLDPGRAAEVAARIGQGTPVSSFDAVVADPELDIVAIASFDDLHVRQVLAALDAGKHVFVEKPLCRSLAEAREVKACWRRRPALHVASNLVLRAAPLYRWLRDEIAAGAFGDVYAIDGDYLYGRLFKITGGWRAGLPDYSVMLGGGVHMVDLMVWLTGQRPAAVSASGNRICTAGTSFRYPDFAAATFTFSSGLVGRITANFGCVHPHHHVLRLFGTKATFLYDDGGARIHSSREGEAPARRLDLAALPATKGDLVPAFVDRIQKDVDPEPVLQHELDVICACAASDRALALGEGVSVEYA